jgi:hypothetical protein
MKKKVIKYITLSGGRCGLSTATDKDILASEGRANVASIRPATREDVDWVRAIGGHIPEGIVRKARQS